METDTDGNLRAKKKHLVPVRKEVDQRCAAISVTVGCNISHRDLNSLSPAGVTVTESLRCGAWNKEMVTGADFQVYSSGSNLIIIHFLAGHSGVSKLPMILPPWEEPLPPP